MDSPKKLCSTNKEALRWCDNRSAVIIFSKNKDGNSMCTVSLGNKCKTSSTVIKAVNEFIKYLDLVKQKKGDKK